MPVKPQKHWIAFSFSWKIIWKEVISTTQEKIIFIVLFIFFVLSRHQANIFFSMKLKPIQGSVKVNIIFSVLCILSCINTHVQIFLTPAIKTFIRWNMQNFVRIFPNFYHQTGRAHVRKQIFNRIHFFLKKIIFVLRFRTLFYHQKSKCYKNQWMSYRFLLVFELKNPQILASIFFSKYQWPTLGESTQIHRGHTSILPLLQQKKKTFFTNI